MRDLMDFSCRSLLAHHHLLQNTCGKFSHSSVPLADLSPELLEMPSGHQLGLGWDGRFRGLVWIVGGTGLPQVMMMQTWRLDETG